MNQPDKGLYSISKVSELTGLTPRQIRYYEDKGLISPRRTEGKQRVYGKKEVSVLKEISNLVKQGMPLSSIVELINTEETKTSAEILKGNTLATQITSLYPLNNRQEVERIVSRLRAIKRKKE